MDVSPKVHRISSEHQKYSSSGVSENVFSARSNIPETFEEVETAHSRPRGLLCTTAPEVERVDFDGAHIAVGDLKATVAERYRTDAAELQLTDAQSGEVRSACSRSAARAV